MFTFLAQGLHKKLFTCPHTGKKAKKTCARSWTSGHPFCFIISYPLVGQPGDMKDEHCPGSWHKLENKTIEGWV